jgi:hypothetical protein
MKTMSSYQTVKQHSRRVLLGLSAFFYLLTGCTTSDYEPIAPSPQQYGPPPTTLAPVKIFNAIAPRIGFGVFIDRNNNGIPEPPSVFPFPFKRNDQLGIMSSAGFYFYNISTATVQGFGNGISIDDPNEKRDGLPLIFNSFVENEFGTLTSEATVLSAVVNTSSPKYFFLLKNYDTKEYSLVEHAVEFKEAYEGKPTFKFRILNVNSPQVASGDQLTVKVSDQNNQPILPFQSIPQGQLTDYVEFPMGQHQFKVERSDNFALKYNENNRFWPLYNYLQGGYYTLIIREDRLELLTETLFNKNQKNEFYGIQLANAHPLYSSIQSFLTESSNTFSDNIPFGTITDNRILRNFAASAVSFVDPSTGAEISGDSYSELVQSKLTTFFIPSQADINKADHLTINYPVSLPFGSKTFQEVALAGFGSNTPLSDMNVYVKFLNLSPDAGQITFLRGTLANNDYNVTNFDTGFDILAGVPNNYSLHANLSFKEGVEYKGYVRLGQSDIEFFDANLRRFVSQYARLDRVVVYNATENEARPGEPLGVFLDNPLGAYPSPGVYTIALTGFFNTTDAALKPRIVVFKHN